MFLLTVDYTSLCLSRLVHLTLSTTGSGFRLVLDSRFPNEIIWFLWKLILDSLKGIIRTVDYDRSEERRDLQ